MIPCCTDLDGEDDFDEVASDLLGDEAGEIGDEEIGDDDWGLDDDEEDVWGLSELLALVIMLWRLLWCRVLPSRFIPKSNAIIPYTGNTDFEETNQSGTSN